jgi:hypothetical protein
VEGILLALDESLPCSWGRGNITREKMDLFLKKLDGFSDLGISLSAGNHVYTNEDLSQYKKIFWELNKNKELAIGLQPLHINMKSKTHDLKVLGRKLNKN